MIRLYPEQLDTQLQETSCLSYLLFGNDYFLLQESEDYIRNWAQKQQFNEYFRVTLDTRTNWDLIFTFCQDRSLFTNRQILLLTLPDKGISSVIAEKLLYFSSLLHSNLLLILRGSKLTKTLENSIWFKTLSYNAVLVICSTPEQTQLQPWVTKRADNMKLILSDAACQLLCYYFENNLLSLTQALRQLSLMYPDGNLTVSRVKKIVNNVAYFTPVHLIDAILTSDINRATYILQQLQIKDVEPVVILRMIQREVMLLLILKRQMTSEPLYILFNRCKVWNDRRLLITQVLKLLSLTQLYRIVTLMTKMELSLKQDYSYNVWSDMNTLVFILCGKILPIEIMYV